MLPEVRHDSAVVLTACVGCIVLSFVTYWPFLDDYFVYDDFIWLRAVRNHSFWTVMVRTFTFPEASRFDEVTLFWRPLTDFYFYAGRPVGVNAVPYHASNVLIHGIVGALAIVLVHRLTNSVATGVLSGLLFVAAPTYDFAVTWISQVSELLAATFILCGLISFHAYLTDERSRSILFAASVGATVLALLSKESSAILLALLPGLVFAVPTAQRRRTAREIAIAIAVFMLLGAAFAVAMLVREYRDESDAYEIGRHMFRNARDYLEWMVLPYRIEAFDELRAALIAAFGLAGVVALATRNRGGVFLFLWAGVALVPFSGFVFGIELRYTYLATLPFVAFVVWSVIGTLRSLPRPLPVVAFAGLAPIAVALLVIVPMRTRDQQAFLAAEASRYEGVIAAVRTSCGAMPQGSFVYIVRPPYRDLYNLSAPAGVNLFYHRVNVANVPELPGLAAFIDAPVCAIEYDAASQQYRRIQ